MTQTNNIIWSPIAGFEERYLISNSGLIKSLKTNKILKLCLDSDGYNILTLYKGSKATRKTYKVHRLVALTFIPNPNSKPTVNHKDTIKTNNEVSNLEWATVSENTQHAYDNNLLSHIGSNNPPSKLTEFEVKEIKTKWATKKYLQKELAKEYGVARQTIDNITSGRQWTHVT